MMQFCTNCGAQLSETAKFCISCGTKVSAPTAPVYAQPAQPFQQQTQPPDAAPPTWGASYTDKQSVLTQATGALNIPGRPWEVTVEGDSIIARWKWMDATFFAPHEINDETKAFTFIVTLGNNGKWKELDKSEEKSSGVNVSGGKIGFGTSSSSFMGKSSKKSFTLGAGKNNETGEVGLISFKFDTASVKQPVRDYLASHGWKKAGLFG